MASRHQNNIKLYSRSGEPASSTGARPRVGSLCRRGASGIEIDSNRFGRVQWLDGLSTRARAPFFDESRETLEQHGDDGRI
eukprot:6210457-Pleurochrysis_carterae.AAC.4